MFDRVREEDDFIDGRCEAKKLTLDECVSREPRPSTAPHPRDACIPPQHAPVASAIQGMIRQRKMDEAAS